MTKIDVSSDAVLLYHIDERGRAAGGAPARDLSQHDVARMAYRRARQATNDLVGRPVDPEDPEAGVIERPDPRNVAQEYVDGVLDELLESGFYGTSPTKKKSKAAKSEAPTTEAPTPDDSAPETAAPAEKPEA